MTTLLWIRLAVTLLAAIGLYTSGFMFAKSQRAERGEIREPSVVKRPAARLFLGIPNALFGLLYYAFAASAVWLPVAVLSWLLLAAALAAALTSLYLAYSLLFITRMPCPFCWTSHAINWLLLVLLARAALG